jgi:hypothetical protein
MGLGVVIPRPEMVGRPPPSLRPVIADDGQDRALALGWGCGPTDLRPPSVTAPYHKKVTSISFFAWGSTNTRTLQEPSSCVGLRSV